MSIQSPCDIFSNKSLLQCIQIVASDPKYWLRECRKTLKLPFMNQIVNAVIKSPAISNEFLDHAFQCSQCSSQFCTYQRLSVHMFRKHGIKSSLCKHVGESTVCPVCLKQFHDRDRLLNHIRYRSRTCRGVIWARGPVITDAEHEDILQNSRQKYRDLHASGHRRHFARAPAFRVSGPIAPHNIIISNALNTQAQQCIGCPVTEDMIAAGFCIL